MSVTVSLPEVTACDAKRCTYNAGGRCHAPAITIGDSVHPTCDTFLADSRHVTPQPVAGVGACKVAGCAHNRERTCHAAAIDVVLRGDEPDCRTFAQRSR